MQLRTLKTLQSLRPDSPSPATIQRGCRPRYRISSPDAVAPRRAARVCLRASDGHALAPRDRRGRSRAYHAAKRVAPHPVLRSCSGTTMPMRAANRRRSHQGESACERLRAREPPELERSAAAVCTRFAARDNAPICPDEHHIQWILLPTQSVNPAPCVQCRPSGW